MRPKKHLHIRSYGLSYGLSYLVGGFKHEFYFSFHIFDVILPIDELIAPSFFKMMIYCTTNQL